MPKRFTPEMSLAALNPALAAQWHPTRNSKSALEVRPASGEKAWFLCENNHETHAFIFARHKGQKCGFCSGRYATPENNLAVRVPDVAKEWHHLKNGKITPMDVLPGSLEFAWWTCPNGHPPYEARIGSRTAASRPSGCPECANRVTTRRNSLAACHPKVAKMWHAELNGDVTPRDVVSGSNLRFWWQCSKKHPPFERGVFSMTRSNGACPYCNRRLAAPETCLSATHPELVLEWDFEVNGKRGPEHYLSGSRAVVGWRCQAHGHTWTAAICNRTGNQTGCPTCPKSVSKPEARLVELLSLVTDVQGDPRVMTAERTWHCDAVLPKKKTVIEYDGWYWHRGPAKHRRDRFKTKSLQDAGWKVIRVREAPLKPLNEGDICVPQNGADEAFEELCKVLRLPKSKAKHKITKVPKSSKSSKSH